MDYKDAGVDVEKGDLFVSRIKKMIGSTFDDRVKTEIGSFAALYKMDDTRYLSAATDGVGTKILLAVETEKFDSIGIDLVAMCVNDLICNGSRPLFFLDYIASAKIDIEIMEKIVQGIVEGCKQSGTALIGGETAEMPGMYEESHFDLAGFAVGEVYQDDILSPSLIQPGQELVAIASSGFHANGYSLIRQLLTDQDTELKKDLLEPTQIYVKQIHNIRRQQPALIKGIANITGGGVQNINRMNPAFEYKLDSLPEYKELLPAMQEIIERSKLGKEKLYNTFNMGMGMVLATENSNDLQSSLKDLNLNSWRIGTIQ